jgi:hypothetical protein
MGTRHLICVYKNQDFKVAQYGQWDGYPEGQGVGVLNFLSTADLAQFSEAIDGVSFATTERRDAWVEHATEHGVDPEADWVDSRIARAFGKKHPQWSRDTGAEILSLIESTPSLKLTDSRTFALDSLFCEWAYVIDFDSGELVAYKGYTKCEGDYGHFTTLFDGKPDRGYYPVTVAGRWMLNDLPTKEDFVGHLEPQEDEED